MSEATEIHSNRPKDNAVLQQRLRAWKPILTVRDACIFFLLCGSVLLAVGLAIHFTQLGIEEVVLDYTNCENPSQTSCGSIEHLYNTSCMCYLSVNIPRLIPKPVFMFYMLSGFYQNHRKYVDSFSPSQLTGETPSEDECSPYYKNAANKTYAPCGMMANALFNDTISMTDAKSNQPVPWSKTNIAAPADKRRYQVVTNWTDTGKPEWWTKTAAQRSNQSYRGDEELLVWLRPAALPNFRKLHRTLLTSNDYANGLPAGNYTLTINYTYPVTSFRGEKAVVISNLGWLGGRNVVLGALYLGTGGLQLVIGLVLLVIHCNSAPASRKERTTIQMQTKL